MANLTVLIVDDEQKICHLIQALGHWKLLNMEVVSVCMDGETALKQMEIHRPDIILTDIRMPIYSGLELIEKGKSLCPDSEFIIISGYPEFEYARKAMSYGVSAYLLKPIEEEALNQALSQALTTISKKRHLEESSLKASEFVEKETQQKKQQLIFSLIEGKQDFPSSIDQCNQTYLANFQEHGEFQIVMITGYQDLEWDPVSHLIKTAACHPHILETTAAVAENRLYWLLQHDFESSEALHKALESCCGDIPTLHLAAGVSVGEIALLPNALKSARCTFLLCPFLTRKLIRPQDLPNQIPVDSLWSTDSLKKLSGALDICDLDGSDQWFLEFCHQVERLNLSHAQAFSDYTQMMIALLHGFLKYDDTSSDSETTPIPSLENLDRISQVHILHQFTLHAINRRLDSLNQKESRPIRLAKQYIDQHYKEPLTLEDVAAWVGFSPAYFSNVFKKYTRQSFTDYLIERRIVAAKELLKNDSASIGEITLLVGYGDDKYFRKLFKKVVGVKPTEYRNLYF